MLFMFEEYYLMGIWEGGKFLGNKMMVEYIWYIVCFKFLEEIDVF